MKIELLTDEYASITIDLPFVPRIGEGMFLSGELPVEAFESEEYYKAFINNHDVWQRYIIKYLSWNIESPVFVTLTLKEE